MSLITQKQLKEILELVETVPEKFQVKFFEIILNSTLNKSPQVSDSETIPVKKVDDKQPIKKTKFVLPIDVKAFLGQYDISEELIWKCFFIENEEIRSIYKLKTTKKKDVQKQHTLMMCLENAIINGQFEVNIEALRENLKELKDYDSVNFSTNIKSFAKLFKEVNKVKNLSLSPDGKSELADLLEILS